MTTYLSVLFLVTYIHFNVININLQSDIFIVKELRPHSLSKNGAAIVSYSRVGQLLLIMPIAL